MIVLRDLPGVAELEANLALPNAKWAPVNDDFDRRCDRVCLLLFGRTPEEADFALPEDWDERFAALADAHGLRTVDDVARFAPTTPADTELMTEWRALAAWGSHFEFLELPFDAQRPVWEALGYDVTDGRGQPLRVLEPMAEAIVAKAKGLPRQAKVISPEALAADVDGWGAEMERQARQFASSKPAGRPAFARVESRRR